MNFNGLLDILFPLIFVAAAVFVIYAMVKSLKEWHENNQKPIEKVKSKVTSKRKSTRRRSSRRGSGSSFKIIYFATFELEDRSRMEFIVGDSIYGMIAEGDIGYLTKQGTRFHDFERVGTDS